MRALFLYISVVHGFFNFFHEQHEAPPEPYEQQVLNSNCQEYLCPSTKQCVKSPVDCGCPFPSSQMKCVLPDGKNYVCISKPAVSDEKLSKVYDGPDAHKARNKGVHDCGWITDIYNGKV